MFGTRAAAASAQAGPAPAQPPEPGEWRFAPPSEATREAVWRLAGPLRRPEHLEQLLGDEYPLASAIAASALERCESRGGHLRADFPHADPDLDGIHLVRAPDGEIRRERWT